MHTHAHAHMHPQVGLRIMKLRMHAHTRTCTHASSGRPAHHEAADDRQRPARGLQASQVSPPQVQDPRAKAAQVRPAVEVHAYMAVDLCICGGGSMHMWRWIYAWSRRWRSNGAAAHGSRWCGTVELEVHWWAFPNQAVVLAVSFKSQVAVLTREAWRRVHSSAVSENLSDATNTVLPGLTSNAHEDHVRTGL